MTIAPTMVSRTPAIAEMMAMMPEPIAEKIEPYGKYCSQDERTTGSTKKRTNHYNCESGCSSALIDWMKWWCV